MNIAKVVKHELGSNAYLDQPKQNCLQIFCKKLHTLVLHILVLHIKIARDGIRLPIEDPKMPVASNDPLSNQ